MSLDIANKKTFTNDDKILFKSGDIFYGQIDFNIVETSNKLVYIGAYGEGEKPTISVARILEKDKFFRWNKIEENIYSIDLKDLTYWEGYKNNDENSCNIGFIKTEGGKKFREYKKE